MTLQLIILIQLFSAHAASDKDCTQALKTVAPQASSQAKVDEKKMSPAQVLAKMEAEIRTLTRELREAEEEHTSLSAQIAGLNQQITFSKITIDTDHPGGGFNAVVRFYLNLTAQSELKSILRELEYKLDDNSSKRAQVQSRLRTLRIDKYAIERSNPPPVKTSDFRYAPVLSEWPSEPRASVPTTGPKIENSAPAPAPASTQPAYNFAEEEERKRNAALERILELTKSSRYAAEELNDLLTLRKLDQVLIGKSVIYFMLGEQWSESLRQTLLDAIQKGYNIIYDADAPHGNRIREIVGAKSIGISAIAEDPTQGILRIANPYRRMMFFDFGRRNSVISPENPSAVGALLMNYTPTTMFRYSGGDHERIISGPAKWQDYLESTSRSGKSFGRIGWLWSEPTPVNGSETDENVKNHYLGVDVFRFQNRPKITSGAVNFHSAHKAASDLNVTAPVSKELERMQPYALKQIEEDITAYSNAMLMASDDSFPRGVVLYGSNSGSPLYENMVRQVSRAASGVYGLMVSGGAGGFMRTANLAATEMDAVSIGVPLGGRASLRTEKRVFHEVQNLTISTNGYETRVPVLGKDRAIALLAPGGKGTLREIATWMFQEANKEDPGLMIFISRAYYGPLVSWLKSLPLPERFKSRISVVDNEEEFFAEIIKHHPIRETDILRVADKIKALNAFVEPTPAPQPSQEAEAQPAVSTPPLPTPTSEIVSPADLAAGIQMTGDSLASPPPPATPSPSSSPLPEPNQAVIGIRPSPPPKRPVFGRLRDDRTRGN